MNMNGLAGDTADPPPSSQDKIPEENLANPVQGRRQEHQLPPHNVTPQQDDQEEVCKHAAPRRPEPRRMSTSERLSLVHFHEEFGYQV